MWIENFQCHSCGSSMGVRNTDCETGKVHENCFCCGAGDFVPTVDEIDGEDAAAMRAIFGREPGFVWQILPRVNTPGYNASSHITADTLTQILSPTEVKRLLSYCKRKRKKGK